MDATRKDSPSEGTRIGLMAALEWILARALFPLVLGGGVFLVFVRVSTSAYWE